MRIALLLSCVVLTACAHDVRASYPSSASEPTGTLVLLLSQAASGVTVAVNGVLVVEDQHTKKVTIDKLPTGNNEIVIAANGSDKAMRTWIASEHPTTIPLGVPESGTSMWKSIFASLVSIIAYSMLR